jgi:predicted RNA-binding Zn-ribbon protein involved in translation (DUF1610 family)
MWYSTLVQNVVQYPCSKFGTVLLFKMWYSTLFQNAVQYSCSKCGTAPFFKMRYSTLVQNVVQYPSSKCGIVPLFKVWYNTLVQSVVQYSCSKCGTVLLFKMWLQIHKFQNKSYSKPTLFGWVMKQYETGQTFSLWLLKFKFSRTVIVNQGNHAPTSRDLSSIHTMIKGIKVHSYNSF